MAERHGDRFLKRVYGPRELEILDNRHDRYPFLAGRFAAKEAAIKALGKFLTERPSFRQLEIVHDNTGQPLLLMSGDAAAKLHHVRSEVSISHERSHAVAVVILWEHA